MSALETSVLIVGGGPIGLALAADLGRRGVAAVLIEKREDKVGPAKMLEVSVRTMEFCRQLGIDHEIHKGPFRPDYPIDSVFVTTMRGFELGRVVIPPLGAPSDTTYSPERMRICPQTWFDPILREKARTYPSIELRYQTQLEDFTQDADGVTAVITNVPTGETRTIQAQYLVGCDGVASTTRELLGIEVRGDKHIDWTMSVYFRFPDFHRMHDKAPAYRYVFVEPNGTWGFMSLIDGEDLWRMSLADSDREQLAAIDVAALVRRAIGCDIPFSVETTTFWVRKRTVADRFRDGRVFIAGDAAHAHPPNGGLGMNTSLQDSFDLGWKLAAVIQGWGGPTLLDSYDIERRPACARATEVSLMNYRRLGGASKYPHIGATSEAGDAARQAAGDTLVRENQKTWNSLGVHLGYVYDPSPIIVRDVSPKPADDTFGYTPSSCPGARAPHVWLADGRSVLDLFGVGFVLLKFAEVSTERIEIAAIDAGLPLEVHEIDVPTAADLYQRKLVLVRPDGHVAWRADHVPAKASRIIDVVRGAMPNVAARRAWDD